MAHLIKTTPSLAPVLTPMLKEAALNWREELDAFHAASHRFPSLTAETWSNLSNFKKYALSVKTAHVALLRSMGLTKEAVRDGKAFMVYHIEAEANKSKFYEAVIVEEELGYRLIRRWGALTDSMGTGRVDGAQNDTQPRFLFPTLMSAKKALEEVYKTRMAHGYIDAFGPKHKTPDGKTLPMGQYPVGLTRTVGFGWGTQSVTKCIPGLRQLEQSIAYAREEIVRTGKSDEVLNYLLEAQKQISAVVHADSSMSNKILSAVGSAIRRLTGSPRFLPDPEGEALGKSLQTVQKYIQKQLSLCS